MRTWPVTLLSVACLTLAACADGPSDPSGLAPVGPLSMSLVSGDGQSGLPGEELSEPLVVSVTDSRGHRIRGQIVNFRVVLGGGSVFAGVAITNADGIARERWTLGASGPQRLEARAVDSETGAALTFQVFTATIIDVAAPVISGVVARPNPAAINDPVELMAGISDVFTGGSTITGGEYNVNGGAFTAMQAFDGSFDSPAESLYVTLPAFGTPGNYVLCVHGSDAPGNTSAETCTTLVVNPPAPPAELSISPTSKDYGTILLGASSPAQMQTFTVSNTGGSSSGPLSVVPGGQNPGDFFITRNTCSSIALAPSATCGIDVFFRPAAPGNRSATLTIVGTPGGSVTVALSGGGTTGAVLTISPTSRDFGSFAVGASSAPQSFTVQNTGTLPAFALAVSVTGPHFADFNVVLSGSSPCFSGISLNPGQPCTVTIVFGPSAVGNRNATLSIASPTAPTVTAAVSGVGLSATQILITPASLQFGGVVVGSAATQSVTLSNFGQQPANLAAPVITGVNASDFGLAPPGCGATLAPGTSCTIIVSFAPLTVGNRTAMLIVDAGPAALFFLSLTGTGLAPAGLQISPTNPGFGSVVVGFASPPVVLTVTNTGSSVTGPLSVLSSDPDFRISSTTCSGPLPGNASCTVTMTFVPVVAGAQSATLTVSASPGGSATATLSGTGLTPATLSYVGASPLNFGNFPVLGGASASQIVRIQNTGQSATGVISTALTGPDVPDFQIVNNRCTGTPLGVGAFCEITLVFDPVATGTRSADLIVSANPGGSVRITLLGTGTIF